MYDFCDWYYSFTLCFCLHAFILVEAWIMECIYFTEKDYILHVFFCLLIIYQQRNNCLQSLVTCLLIVMVTLYLTQDCTDVAFYFPLPNTIESNRESIFLYLFCMSISICMSFYVVTGETFAKNRGIFSFKHLSGKEPILLSEKGRPIQKTLEGDWMNLLSITFYSGPIRLFTANLAR